LIILEIIALLTRLFNLDGFLGRCGKLVENAAPPLLEKSGVCTGLSPLSSKFEF